MALGHKDVGEEKKTGFTFRGREIVLSKTRGNTPMTRKGFGIRTKQGWYPESAKIEVVTLWAAIGNVKKISELTRVPEKTIRGWRKQEWFAELLKEIREENDGAIDNKFTEIIYKALDQLGDRVDNGDYVLTKDGDLRRKPMGGRDLAIVGAINFDKRNQHRQKPEEEKKEEKLETTAQRLEKLVTQFTEIAQKAGKKQIPAPQEPIDVDYTEVKTDENPSV